MALFGLPQILICPLISVSMPLRVLLSTDIHRRLRAQPGVIISAHGIAAPWASVSIYIPRAKRIWALGAAAGGVHTPQPWTISGFELPPSVYEGNTFIGEPSDAAEGHDILMCARPLNATAKSSRDPDDPRLSRKTLSVLSLLISYYHIRRRTRHAAYPATESCDIFHVIWEAIGRRASFFARHSPRLTCPLWSSLAISKLSFKQLKWLLALLWEQENQKPRVVHGGKASRLSSVDEPSVAVSPLRAFDKPATSQALATNGDVR